MIFREDEEVTYEPMSIQTERAQLIVFVIDKVMIVKASRILKVSTLEEAALQARENVASLAPRVIRHPQLVIEETVVAQLILFVENLVLGQRDL